MVASGKQSNRADVENALKYCCLNSAADVKKLNAALAAIESADRREEEMEEGERPKRYLLLLSADARMKYQGLYLLEHPDAAARKKGEREVSCSLPELVHPCEAHLVLCCANQMQVRGMILAGKGPPRLRGEKLERSFRYDSVTKQFISTRSEEEDAQGSAIVLGSDECAHAFGSAPVHRDPEAVCALTMRILQGEAIRRGDVEPQTRR